MFKVQFIVNKNTQILFTMQKLCIFTILLSFSACFNEIQNRPVAKTNQAEKVLVSNNSKETNMVSEKFYTFKAKTLDGTEVSFEQYRGKKIIILNTASECGFTPQYADWEAFYKANKEKVVVLGFPCNQFGGQESGSGAEIKTFCEKNYGVTFPVFEKIDVKGERQAPLFDWLSHKDQNGWCDKTPSWNFCKYLVSEKGELLNFFASGIKPGNDEFLQALKK